MYKRKFFVAVKKQKLLELVADKVIDILTTKKRGSKEKKLPGLVADRVIDAFTTKKAEKHWKNGNRVAGFCRVR